MPQFELANALPQIVWLAIIFAILYLTLAYGALPKVDKVVARRASAIGDDLATAERVKGEAETTLTAYEATLAEARGAATTLAADAKASTARETEAKLKALDATLEARSGEAATRIEAARGEALKSLDTVAAEAAVEIVERLTGKRPSTGDALAALGA